MLPVQTLHGTRSSPLLHAPFESGNTDLPPETLNIVRANPSFFEGAHHFRVENFQSFNANHVTITPLPHTVESLDGWKLLVERIAPNALHNSDARYDAPKCDEDTRVEVTGELMDWIKDRDGTQRLLCMTGAAGSGKSALQQTIAERCVNFGILGSAYFFSSADPTRNSVSTVVPTIAFQVGSHNPDLRQYISTVVAEDPVIFKRSLRTQMDSLLVRPMKDLRERAGLDLATLPHAILIDCLDECKGEDRQEELLTAIRESLLTNDLPFRIFIASRPEWAIRTALEPGGHLHAMAYHIQLSEHYDASGDMRRYLRRRFQDLSLRTFNPHWFTESDIENLVQAASGQFIYVATVYRYISERRTSPPERLKIVLTWTPHEGRIARPFEALDKLYADTLVAAKHAYEAVDTHSGRDFLLLFACHLVNTSSIGFPYSPITSGGFELSNSRLTEYLFLEAGSTEILFSDLRSLVKVGNTATTQYLDSNLLEEATHHLPVFWTKASPMDDDILDFTQKGGWHKLDSVHAENKVYYSCLLNELDSLTRGLKNRNPEVVGVMSMFFNKWILEYEEYENQKRLEERLIYGIDSDEDSGSDSNNDSDWDTDSRFQ
ncbi:hypothetical protein H1R20_g16338, partial [Candolleomyces eurysporus]